ncbi:NfeD family protein [Pseudovibrio sp. SPO723]|uniref:NfeD family protein n=1 Tax=Nesiotobacter zosterae TaxID=392721 RepID=UPI0029C13177|nr:NfeD family protein [Pseudovibrio sp. SPO723]MDX5594718.1 NfeD family protein [Pseudovibrio sp. SPO723]
MRDIVDYLGPYTWWVLGLILLGLEIIAPGFVFLWFAIAAIMVGVLAMFVDLTWQWMVFLFGVLSLTTLIVGRKWASSRSKNEGDEMLNQRGSRYIGRTFILRAPIEQGQGSLNIDDTVWRVRGPDLPEGTLVKVVRIEGVSLVVEEPKAT